MRVRTRWAGLASVLAAGWLAAAAPAAAAPGAFIPVGDPLEAEWRVLEVWPAGSHAAPHLGMRPLQRREGLAPTPAAAAAALAVGPRSLALRRLAREWARDALGDAGALAPGVTPRLLTREGADGSRFEASAGLAGSVALARESGAWSKPGWSDGSGVRLRLTATTGPWVAHTDLAAGQLSGVRTFSDALIEGRDIALSTDDSYLALAPDARWDARAGRARTHWGPGEEASLLLSGTAPALGSLALRWRIAPLATDLAVLHATTDPGRGEQLAAHRLEWQPRAGLRLGLAEAARYRASGWQAVYLASVIPFSLAQRLLDQDAGGPDDSLRNNVLVSADAAWRVADGTRLYGELLLDDVHARSRAFPDKWGYQLGLDGAGGWAGTRLTWNVEYTRLSRYVYTSYYGRAHTARGVPLGSPIGPDARRLRVRISWDLTPAWQGSVVVSRTDRGEGGLGQPFVPGSPLADPMRFAGVVETSRTLGAEARWWPASGVDAALRVGRERVEHACHVSGATREAWTVQATLALWR